MSLLYDLICYIRACSDSVTTECEIMFCCSMPAIAKSFTSWLDLSRCLQDPCGTCQTRTASSPPGQVSSPIRRAEVVCLWEREDEWVRVGWVGGWGGVAEGTSYEFSTRSPSWFPWPACLPLGFPVCFVVVAPNPWILSSEFVNSYQQQPVCCYVSFFSILSPSQASLQYTLSINSLYLHTLPMSKLHQRNRFFFSGVMTPTLLPVRPAGRNMLG